MRLQIDASPYQVVGLTRWSCFHAVNTDAISRILCCSCKIMQGVLLYEVCRQCQRRGYGVCVRPRSRSTSAATALATALLFPQRPACGTPAVSSQWVPLLARPLLHYLHLHTLPADKVTLSVAIPVQMLLAYVPRQLCQTACI